MATEKDTAYLGRFLKLRCAPDVLPYFQCPNPVKEITESMAVVELALQLRDPRHDTFAVVIGDGVLPRTAALLAHRTYWHVYSIDPRMRQSTATALIRQQGTRRVYLRDYKWEEFNWCDSQMESVFLFPHAHVDLKAFFKQVIPLKPNSTVIALPCCTNIPDPLCSLTANRETGYMCYVDPYVWSPKNVVHAWPHAGRAKTILRAL